MTQSFQVRHLRAFFYRFAFFFHKRAVKLTMKRSKNTKKFAFANGRPWSASLIFTKLFTWMALCLLMIR